MLDLDLYILATGSIVPAPDLQLPVTQLLCSEPDYTAFIQPMQLRRMSKIVRMGIGAARSCMQAAGIEKPDALSIGTAMGCLKDTEAFLTKMVTQEEKMLTPTSFIQSTHNTVGGQIALWTGCYGHNMTYVQGGHSFEQAILNTKLYLQDHPGETVLAGGIDELTPTSHVLLQRAGLYSQDEIAPATLLQTANNGSIGGEGACFFTIKEQREAAAVHLKSLHVFTADTTQAATEEVQQFLLQQSIDLQEIDLVVLGENGDIAAADFYEALQTEVFAGNDLATFKQLCGEYATASAFGLSLIANGLINGRFPATFFSGNMPIDLQKVLLINHYCDHYSCWYMEKV